MILRLEYCKASGALGSVSRLEQVYKAGDMDATGEGRLRGKVAIVSGAGTYGGRGVGNGAATAIVFARQGARVALVDAVGEWADATRAIIAEEGGEAMTAAADVTNPDECGAVVDAVAARFGGVDILHNNVGGGGAAGGVVEATPEDWMRSASVNLMSMINMCRYAIPHMRAAGGGAIVNVSSVTALRPKAGRSSAPYTVNKSAVVGLTRAMALDHAADNIRVNCIMPGLMWTPRVASGAAERDARSSSTPLPVEGAGWDIGNAALFLASDEARFVTGVTLPVDGGFLLTSAPN